MSRNSINFVGESDAIRAIRDLLPVVAVSSSTVLITGESGTGKESAVAAIHDASKRSDKTLVTVNCGALPEALMESELFGHARGAFTGAHVTRLGRVAQAEGGTLFLDEIGELPMPLQAKLLRLLQQREYTPVGDNRTIKCDIRIIAATNRKLADEVARGTFREDLYYRLNVFPIMVPSLRERPDDVAPLARHFIARFAAEENKAVSGLTPAASQLIGRFSWPGNVRQLENTIFRAVVLCDGSMLDVCDFPQIAAAMGVEAVVRQNVAVPVPVAGEQPALGANPAYAMSVTDAAGHIRKFEDMESDIIRMAIGRYEGHMSEVARRLGIGRSTLYRKLKEFGLEPVEGLVAEDVAQPAMPQQRKAG